MFPTIDRSATGLNIRRIMDERNLTAKEVQEYLCLGTVQSVYHWFNGISMPTVDNLYAMSELFQVTIDEMLCGNRKTLSRECDRFRRANERIYTYYTKLNEAA